MKNAVHSDQDFREAYGADAAPSPPGFQSSPRLVEDEVREQRANVMRFKTMEQETTDPLGARLLHDIISDMEAELSQVVDRIVAERH
ncbi:hypothetical protein JQ616_05455 [Bradyrhizobium tropiciagri]|uniref:hypothetical protein n=1 Tax=Bradyrhizobium tropiciagri TaxID=312253 RepID=UPI001BAD8179|nr:hypothetical protein [Bradyrhizobium tropiciagri]MBR0894389.1 hypothetical protein [Bradyrhizobium tropiciagri]